ncbi:MAG: SWIM zinc finger family protein [Longimicrobiales bacterium]|nr:SWIM zinc finger family protein [Longimicrobiales bacterium]
MGPARGSWYYSSDFHFPPPSRPRKTKGGIKAQSKRGAFGESWWARRWVEVLESFDIGARLARGRKYARQGQVTDIQIEEGRVTAQVQGSRPRPYSVTIVVKTLTEAQWKKVARRLGEEARYAAKLLAGEIPTDIEDVFRAAGVTLFPSRSQDLVTDCSCPDWSNPCKHIAAVYYLLGEEFDRDPFLIFKLRGMTRSALLESLHGSPGAGKGSKPASATPAGKRGARAKGHSARPPKEEQAPAPTAPSPEPLLPDPAGFWGSAWPGAGSPEAEAAPTRRAGAALARRLGSFPFWRGRGGFLEAMDHACSEAEEAGLEILARLAEGQGRP